jgi:hypothetical protein
MPILDSLVPITHFFSGCVRMFIGTSAWTPGSCVCTVQRVYGVRSTEGGPRVAIKLVSSTPYELLGLD